MPNEALAPCAAPHPGHRLKGDANPRHRRDAGQPADAQWNAAGSWSSTTRARPRPSVSIREQCALGPTTRDTRGRSAPRRRGPPRRLPETTSRPARSDQRRSDLRWPVVVEPSDGGALFEGGPSRCPAGHRMGAPVDGVVLSIRGHEPCRCPAARHGGHRTWHCEKPGCPDPWWRDGTRGPCTNEGRATTRKRTYAPGRSWHRQLAPPRTALPQAASGDTTRPSGYIDTVRAAGVPHRDDPAGLELRTASKAARIRSNHARAEGSSGLMEQDRRDRGDSR